MKELFEVADSSTLIQYMLKEIEHTWRIKFSEIKELVYPAGVDQFHVIIDLKGVKLKDLSNKELNLILRALLSEWQKFYPEMLDRCFIVNSPMFFEGFWDSEIKPYIKE